MKRNLLWVAALAIIACVVPLTSFAEDKADEIPGLLIEQADGTFFNLQVENNNFTVYLFDKDKKDKLPVPYTHGRIRYQPFGRERQEGFLASASDGLSLRSPHTVRRPFVFQFWLFLFEKGKAEAAFTLNGHFSQPMPGDGESVSLYDMLGTDGRPPAKAAPVAAQRRD